LQAILGLQADAPHQCFYIDPELPPWIPELTLRSVEVGSAHVDLQFWREDERTCWDATVQSGNIEIKQKAWQPWKLES
jgi:hypothetical protein